MPTTRTPAGVDLDRHHDVLRTPACWPAWPFLPVVRRGDNGDEYGLLFDRADGSAAGRFDVFLANLFLLPATLAAFLALPRESFDAAEAVTTGGWRVD